MTTEALPASCQSADNKTNAIESSDNHTLSSSAMASKHNDLKIMPKAIVCECDESVFQGDITVSSGCVIHPRVTIIAKSGPIIIGENCLIEEYTTIIFDTGEDKKATDKPPSLVIGANNVFEVGCRVEAHKIGEKNVFECKCFVSAGVKITNNCIIGAGYRLVGERTLAENTIVITKNDVEREAIENHIHYSYNFFGNYCRTIIWCGKPLSIRKNSKDKFSDVQKHNKTSVRLGA